MAEHVIRFEVDAALAREAGDVAAELGVTVQELGKTAFEAYMAGVREVRQLDLDLDRLGRE